MSCVFNSQRDLVLVLVFVVVVVLLLLLHVIVFVVVAIDHVVMNEDNPLGDDSSQNKAWY